MFTFASIPGNVMTEILVYLDPQDLCALSQVERETNRVLRRQETWLMYLVGRSGSIRSLQKKITRVTSPYYIIIEYGSDNGTISMYRYRYLDMERFIGAIIGAYLLKKIDSRCLGLDFRFSKQDGEICRVGDVIKDNLLPDYYRIDELQDNLRIVLNFGVKVEQVIIKNYSQLNSSYMYILRSTPNLRWGLVEMLGRFGWDQVELVTVQNID